MIDDRLAEDILDNKLNRDAIIHLSVKDDELKFENVKGKRKETLVTDTAE